MTIETDGRGPDAETGVRRLFERVPIGIYRTTPEGEFLVANPAMLQMLGSPDMEALKGMRAGAFYHDSASRKEWKERMEREDVVRHFRTQLKCNDGTVLWVEDNSRAIRNENGDLLYYEGSIEDISRWMTAKDALETEKAYYREFIETLTDWIWEMDIDGIHTYSNPAIKELLGYEVEEIIGRAVTDLWLDDTRTGEMKKVHRQMLAEGTGWRNFKGKFRHRDGSTVIVESTAIPIVDPEKGLVGYRGMDRDITENTMTERALRDSEEMFRMLSDQSLLGIVILQAGVFKYANKAAADVIGYSVREMMSWQPYDFAKVVHDDDREFVMDQERRKEAGEGDVVTNYQYRVITKSGQTKWIDQYSKTIEYGGSTADLVSFIDITGRRWAENALSTSVRQWVSTFDSMRDAVSLLDGDGVIIQCNRATSRLLDRPFTEIIGMEYRDLVHGPGGPDEGRPIETVFGNGERATQVIQKGKQWLRVTIDPIVDDAGKVTGAVHIISDITEGKEAEERIRSSLREKEVMLKEIHHRVKNNLQVISSMLNLQVGSLEDVSTADLFRDSQNRIRSMALIHERLYRSADLARVELGEYLDSLVVSLRRSYLMDGSSIHIELCVEDVELGIDQAIPFGLIINELVSNSLKHAFHGSDGGTVKIGFRIVDGQYELTVSDDGVGLPPDLDFETAGSMGMVLVRTLVEQLEGTVELGRDEGATFTVMFAPDGKEVT